MRVLPASVQLIAARVLLELEQAQLARLAKVDRSTIVRLESAGWRTAPGHASTVARVVDALEGKGIEFVVGGVRLTRKPHR